MDRPRYKKQEGSISGPNSLRKTSCPLHSRNYAIKTDKFQYKELQCIIQRRTYKPSTTWRSSNLHPWQYTFQKITINTPLQATEARINIGIDVTIVSIYKSRSYHISENLLSTLFHQLPKPVILTGDFNSYNKIWGSTENDVRGVKV